MAAGGGHDAHGDRRVEEALLLRRLAPFACVLLWAVGAVLS
jgi:hypothetical protein